MSVASKKPEVANGGDPAAPVYALLAELLSREIDEPLLDLLRLPEVKEILVGISPEVAPDLEKSWGAKEFENYAVEFCRLFIHPCECLPLAGRWAKGCEEEQFSVRRWFDKENLSTILPSQFAELSDTHIAKILSVRARLSNASEEVVREFEKEMIQPWVSSFSMRLSETTPLPLYRAVAALLAALS